MVDELQRSVDLKRLRSALKCVLGKGVRESFAGLLQEMESGERYALSPKQRSRVSKVLDEQDPQYKNLASTGKVKARSSVETPWMLRPENLPKKPPGYGLRRGRD